MNICFWISFRIYAASFDELKNSVNNMKLNSVIKKSVRYSSRMIISELIAISASAPEELITRDEWSLLRSVKESERENRNAEEAESGGD